MYKAQTRFMQRSNFTPYSQRRGLRLGGGFRRKKHKKAVSKFAALKTEPELVAVLGTGPNFVRTVYRRYRHDLAKLGHDTKKCSAYLNIVAGVRMRDGSLWTDKAVESMFRRVLSK